MTYKFKDDSAIYAWNRFVTYLKERNYRTTPERKIILDVAFNRHDHFTAIDLYNNVKEISDKIGRATVFRTLDLMVSCNLVKRIQVNKSHVIYEHIFGHAKHDHMVCDNCGKYIEFIHPDIDSSINSEAKRLNFTVRDYKTLVFGMCEICSEKSLKKDNKKWENYG